MTSPASTLPRGSRAWRPRATRTPCGQPTDRIPVTTCETSALNSTPTSASSAHCRGLEQHYAIRQYRRQILRRQVPDLSRIVATSEDDFDRDAFAHEHRLCESRTPLSSDLAAMGHRPSLGSAATGFRGESGQGRARSRCRASAGHSHGQACAQAARRAHHPGPFHAGAGAAIRRPGPVDVTGRRSQVLRPGVIRA